MIKKTTFALAGALGIVAAATLSTTAGAADTDAALANNVKFYVTPGAVGASGEQEATTTCKTVLIETAAGQVTQARSAELLVLSDKVQLFSDTGCESVIVATLSSPDNVKDLGAGWGGASVRSFKLAPSP